MSDLSSEAMHRHPCVVLIPQTLLSEQKGECMSAQIPGGLTGGHLGDWPPTGSPEKGPLVLGGVFIPPASAGLSLLLCGLRPPVSTLLLSGPHTLSALSQGAPLSMFPSCLTNPIPQPREALPVSETGMLCLYTLPKLLSEAQSLAGF